MRDSHAYTHPHWCQRGRLITSLLCYEFFLCAWMCSAVLHEYADNAPHSYIHAPTMVSAGVPNALLGFVFVVGGLNELRSIALHLLGWNTPIYFIIFLFNESRTEFMAWILHMLLLLLCQNIEVCVCRLGMRRLLWTAQLILFMHLGCGGQDSPLVWWTRFNPLCSGQA